jgi:hypothetical protein
MANDLELGNALSEIVQDAGCVIRAAIVYDNDFQLGRDTSAHFGRLVDDTGDIALFVETGDYDGKAHRAEG